MVAQLVYENPELFNSLFLLGTSHPRDIDLFGIALPAIKIYAQNDGLSSVNEILDNMPLLPLNS
jgi:hypothetical protein